MYALAGFSSAANILRVAAMAAAAAAITASIAAATTSGAAAAASTAAAAAAASTAAPAPGHRWQSVSTPLNKLEPGRGQPGGHTSGAALRQCAPRRAPVGADGPASSTATLQHCDAGRAPAEAAR